MIQLVRPTEAMKEQAIEFRQEFFEHGEFVINGSELFDKTDDYTEWCRATDANTKEETVNPNWVKFPDDRRSYTEGKQECIECLLKEADVWKSTLF